MATQDDRSINSGGMSLPMWMKTKMNDTRNLEQNAFSPTELDDSFMFYYKSGFRGSSEPPVDNKVSLVEAAKTIQTAPVSNDNQKPDFSKHTPFCQRYLTGNSETAKPAGGGTATRIKSSGVDDGFKGEAAKCGTSVIKVANQMVAGKVVYGFNYTRNNDCEDSDVLDGPPKGFNPLARRDSKSLPASPLGSPKGSRKNAANKYFTSPFVDNENHHGSWILANLLGKRQQTLSQSVGHIPEDETVLSAAEKTQSNVSLDVAADDGAKKAAAAAAKNQVFVAKPSELREMNFWSPTSM